MTYIQLVNAVLRKLREGTVQVVAETEYSSLIGDFVNDALTYVEGSWDWSALRESFPILTVDGTGEYSLTGFGTSSEIMSVYNLTEKYRLTYQPKEYLIDKKYRSNAYGAPRDFTNKGTDNNNDLLMVLYPTPNGAFNMVVDAVVRNKTLVNDVDSTKLPTLPIVQLAFAYALRERGETGGQGAMEQIMIADRDLSSAIALDAGNNAGELVWRPV
tara:strand:- start:9252 stop:9896 length:645 start_codon:yes stop_codon:yes gene_type:complete